MCFWYNDISKFYSLYFIHYFFLLYSYQCQNATCECFFWNTCKTVFYEYFVIIFRTKYFWQIIYTISIHLFIYYSKFWCLYRAGGIRFVAFANSSPRVRKQQKPLRPEIVWIMYYFRRNFIRIEQFWKRFLRRCSA